MMWTAQTYVFHDVKVKGALMQGASDPPSPRVGTRLTMPVPVLPVIGRDRIHRALDEAITHPVTLVTGGVGSGKTIAVADWARHARLPGPLVWATLLRSDATPPALWSTLREAAAPLLDPGALQEITPAGGALAEGTVVLQGLAPHQTVLVLDDVDTIEAGAAAAELREILRRPPAGLHLVIISQHERLAFQRLGVAGDLGHIGSRDLTFTTEEGRALLGLHGLHLTDSALAYLMATTQGWATGLRLAGIALTSDAAPAAPTLFGGHHPVVIDYVLEELDTLGERARHVAMSACIVNEVAAPLATALSDDHQAGPLLLDLARDGFLRTRADGASHRMPTLIRQALRAHLLATLPETHADLHRRAAVWFEDQGDWVPALRHALHSRDWDFVGALGMRSLVPSLHGPDRTRLCAQLAKVPDRAVHGRTELEITMAHVLLGQRNSAAQALLEHAETRILRLPEPRRTLAVLACSTLRSSLAHRAGDASAMLAAATAAQGILHTLDARDAPGWLARPGVVASLLAKAHLWSGNPGRSVELLSSEVPGITAMPPLGPDEAGHLALAQVARGRISLGRCTAQAVLGDGTWDGHDTEHFHAAWLALAAGAMFQGDVVVAEQALSHVHQIPAGADPFLDAGLHLVTAGHRLLRGDVPAARQALAAFDAHSSGLTGVVGMDDARAGLGLALELGAGGTARARSLLEQHGTRAAPSGLLRLFEAQVMLATGRAAMVGPAVRTMLEGDGVPATGAWLMVALAEDALRHDSQAIDALSRSLDLGAADGLLALYAPAGPRLASILARHLEVVGTHAGFVGQVLDRTTGKAVVEIPRPTQMLTDRELSVLAYLPTLNSNSQIAACLGISVNTVKQHLKSIHRKLGVTSRRDALQAARRLDLLPDRGVHSP